MHGCGLAAFDMVLRYRNGRVAYSWFMILEVFWIPKSRQNALGTYSDIMNTIHVRYGMHATLAGRAVVSSKHTQATLRYRISSPAAKEHK
jgi:hypothetical protein